MTCRECDGTGWTLEVVDALAGVSAAEVCARCGGLPDETPTPTAGVARGATPIRSLADLEDDMPDSDFTRVFEGWVDPHRPVAVGRWRLLLTGGQVVEGDRIAAHGATVDVYSILRQGTPDAILHVSTVPVSAICAVRRSHKAAF